MLCGPLWEVNDEDDHGAGREFRTFSLAPSLIFPGSRVLLDGWRAAEAAAVLQVSPLHQPLTL
jgi:hypothetical protein